MIQKYCDDSGNIRIAGDIVAGIQTYPGMSEDAWSDLGFTIYSEPTIESSEPITDEGIFASIFASEQDVTTAFRNAYMAVGCRLQSLGLELPEQITYRGLASILLSTDDAELVRLAVVLQTVWFDVVLVCDGNLSLAYRMFPLIVAGE